MLFYLLSQIFALLLPGFSLLHFSGFNTTDRLKNFFLSYGIGYAWTIFLYSILLVFNLQNYALIATLISSGLCLLFSFVLYKRGRFFYKSSSQDWKFILILALCLFFIYSLTFLLENHFAGSRTELKIDQDLMYWFRNSASAVRGFPLEDLSIAGVDFYYHYFSCFYITYIYIISGLELFDICFTWSVFTNIVLLLGSFYLFADYFLKEKAAKYLCIFLMLFCAGFDYVTLTIYSSKFFLNSFGCLEGFSMCLLTLLLFFKFFDEKSFSPAKLFIILLLFYAATGCKAPLACIFMLPVGIACFSLLFKRETFFKGCITGLSILFVFTFVYILFISCLYGALITRPILQVRQIPSDRH